MSMTGIKRQRPVKRGQGFFQTAKALQHQTAAIPDFRIGRIARGGGIKLRQRFCGLARAQQQHAMQQKRLGGTRRAHQRRFHRLQRLDIAALPIAQRGQHVLHLEIIRIASSEHLPDKAFGIFRLSLLVQRNSLPEQFPGHAAPFFLDIM